MTDTTGSSPSEKNPDIPTLSEVHEDFRHYRGVLLTNSISLIAVSLGISSWIVEKINLEHPCLVSCLGFLSLFSLTVTILLSARVQYQYFQGYGRFAKSQFNRWLAKDIKHGDTEQIAVEILDGLDGLAGCLFYVFASAIILSVLFAIARVAMVA